MKTYFIYIVLCSDNSYYTGLTNNLERRIEEHNMGIDSKCYTYKKRPVKLMFSESFSDANTAIFREKQLKGWSRSKKEALFRGDFEEIKKLSKRRRG